jgi:rubrerythrin
MSQWRCSVCGYSHDDSPPPSRCPVCGADQNKREESPTASKVEDAGPAPNMRPVRQWQCRVCGYIHEGAEPPDECPVCGADRSEFVALDADEETTAAPQTPSAAAGPEHRWQCTICGYVHIGPEPPERCPVCGADRSKFILLEEAPGPAVEPAAEEITDTPALHPIERLLSRHRRLIDFAIANHAHPITVHIPNGVLPIAVAMVLLNALFDLPALGRAAFYNMIFILAAMPAVLFSGYLHWRFKFGGQLTNLFKGKIACGTLVFLLAAVLVIWPLLDAPIIAQPSINYILLHLAMLAAGTVAGWLGGRLVFHRNV